MSINITGAGVSSGSGLALHPISLISPKSGGYRISYSGRMPHGCGLSIGLPDATNAMDVSARCHHHNLLDATNLHKFLERIGNRNWWGTRGRAQLLVTQDRAVVASSNTVDFDCPIKPLVCHPRLTQPNLGLSRNELVGLHYAADDKHGNGGRFLNIPAIDGCYYFLNGDNGKFETDNSKRGLVCTTYVGAVWGLAATSGGPMTWTGADIASEPGEPFYCKDVGMKGKQLKEVKAFLQAHRLETYLVGSSSHIVLVVKGTVHDFTTAPRLGYNMRDVRAWHPSSRHTWTIGKPKVQF